jgi:hypothetical protein
LLPPTRPCSPSAGSSGLAGMKHRNATTSWPSHCKGAGVGWWVLACVSKAKERGERRQEKREGTRADDEGTAAALEGRRRRGEGTARSGDATRVGRDS